MENLQEKLRSVFAGFPDIQLCIIFGSTAAGKASPSSDLDIAVAAAKPLDAERRLDLIAAISAATGWEIDLIDLMTVSGPIMRQVLSKGIIVHNRNKQLYAQLILRMLFNQSDMMPYYDRILRERRSRFLNG
jgi:predicted nucleotidyltransferase